MRLVGTAGHVDHGKSTLVQALTGINPDRLKEEQAREMTIDLGFAWLTLPHGETISLVDVPGHEAFIKNMLAGAGGMDIVMLVVAADEGIMPQTREHLAILDMLQVKGGVIALTKTDLPLEAEWLDLVRDEIQKAIHGTVLSDAEIIPVSARSGEGLDALRSALERALAKASEKNDRGRPRLPIDRVFTMSGFGTVVTGTLSDGHFSSGDEVEIAPRGILARIRGLQVHKAKLNTVQPGGRAALNLAGVATDELQRGDTVILPGTFEPSQLLDVQIEWLPSAPKPLTHNQHLELFLYAAQVGARVRLLEADSLAPGGHGWAQLVLDAPVIAAKGDRFILRYASPSITVGGGVVIAPNPTARYRRRQPKVLEQLERAALGTPAELLIEFIGAHPGSDLRTAAQGLGLETEAVEPLAQAALDQGELVALDAGAARVLITANTWQRWREQMKRELTAYHKQFPLRTGMPREEFKSRLNLPARLFDSALALASENGTVRATAKTVALPEHRVEFDAATRLKVDALLEQFARSPYNPPMASQAEEAVGGEVLNALVEQGQLERLNPQVLVLPSALNEMQAWVLDTLKREGEITAAQVRDRFETSRKYAIALLEYLDARHITRRMGDVRVLR